MSDELPKIVTWKGRRADELTREELLEALSYVMEEREYLFQQLKSSNDLFQLAVHTQKIAELRPGSTKMPDLDVIEAEYKRRGREPPK